MTDKDESFDYEIEKMEDLKYWVALHSVEGIGPSLYNSLLERFGEPEEVLRASLEDLTQIPHLTEEKARGIQESTDRLEEIEDLLLALDDQGVRIMTIREEDYPEGLLDLKNPPPLLYLYGNIKEEDSQAVAIVGTRKPSEEGYQKAKDFAKGLVEVGFTIVSGYADGIDTAGHLGAIESEGRTIMVLSSGINHFQLKEGMESLEFLRERGVILSEFFPKAPWSVGGAMARNQLVCGLSRAVLVVEAGLSGGTLNTAEEAQKMKKPLFVYRYQNPPPSALGNEGLIKNGAIGVESYEELMQALEENESLVI